MVYRVIAFHYTLRNQGGDVLDSSEGGEPLAFLEGHQQIIPGLEKELITLKKGDKRTIVVNADEAYGPREEQLVVQVPRSQFPVGQKLEVGQRFMVGEGPGGSVFAVVAVSDTHVSLDGNHPLAGADLHFDVTIADVRPASADEIAHGHAHGVGGVHH
jgi:FKBP-type peptidyl-prolyl cis-trans isomerase SlyD